MAMRTLQWLVLLSFSVPFQTFCGPCASKPQKPPAQAQAKQSQEPIVPFLQREESQNNQKLNKAIADNTPLVAALVPLVAEYAKRNYIMQRKKYTDDMRCVTKLIPLNPYCVAAARDAGGADIYDVTSATRKQEQQKFEGVPSSNWTSSASASIVALSHDEFAQLHSYKSPNHRNAAILDIKYTLAIKNMSDPSKNRAMQEWQALFHITRDVIALSPDRIASVSNVSRIKIWDAQSCRLESEFNMGLGGYTAKFLIAMPNDRILVGFNDPGQTVSMYDLATKKRLWGIWNKEIIDHMIKLTDDTILIIGSRRGGDYPLTGSVMRLIDSQMGHELGNSHAKGLLLDHQVTSVQMLSTDRVALSLRENGNVLIIDPKRFVCIGVLPTHRGTISCFARIGNILISGSEDGSIVLRNMINHEIVARLTHNYKAQDKAQEQPDQRQAAGAAGASLSSRALAQGGAQSAPNERSFPITALAKLSDSRFASGDAQGTVAIWEFDISDVGH